jgi:hypothetical protein
MFVRARYADVFPLLHAEPSDLASLDLMLVLVIVRFRHNYALQFQLWSRSLGVISASRLSSSSLGLAASEPNLRAPANMPHILPWCMLRQQPTTALRVLTSVYAFRVLLSSRSFVGGKLPDCHRLTKSDENSSNVSA